MIGLERYLIIAGPVGLADYLQSPEAFEGLISLLADSASQQEPSPNAVGATEVKGKLVEGRDSGGIDLSSFWKPLLRHRASKQILRENGQ